MVERVWFKPAPGVKVPLGRLDPGQYFPPEGALVARDEYIERRLRDGAGTIVENEVDRAAKDASATAITQADVKPLPKKP